MLAHCCRFIFFLFLLGHFSVVAQPCDSLFFVANDARLAGDFQTEQRELEKAYLSPCQNSSRIVAQLALTYIEQADRTYSDGDKGSKNQQETLFKKGLSLAHKAVRLNPKNTYAHEHVSLAYAGLVSISSIRNQAILADSVRVYAEQALEADPTNDRALHILGRWHYEVSNLGWILKFFSRLIFGTAPNGSYDEAIRYFQASVDLDDFPVHNYWLAMAYLKKGNKTKAIQLFQHAVNLPEIYHNDNHFKQKSREMLAELGS